MLHVHLSIDLEVGLWDRRIRCFAAVRGENDAALVFEGSNLAAALQKLEKG